MMKRKILMGIVAGAFLTVSLMPTGAWAGNGRMGGQRFQTQTRSSYQTQDRLRLRDGSCLKSTAAASGTAQQKGNTYGPGDGTGNAGVGPKDGTGYGAPANR